MVRCYEREHTVHWRDAEDFTWCAAEHFLLSHMPSFDMDFLPPAVAVEGASMLDDTIAFSLMAWNASQLFPKPPIKIALTYLLPYATLHESRANWRPIFFAKYFKFANGLRTSRDILAALIVSGVTIMNWTAHTWPGFSGLSPLNSYDLGPFAASSTPPVLAPFDFVAYGYASCTGWAKFLASALKAVGVPAREVGSPCWNTAEFSGSATSNPNVSMCWKGGLPNKPGGRNLNDHTWVEYWDNEASDWHFVDVSTSSVSENTWFCGTFTDGCECSSNAGKASQDHEVLAPTWSPRGDDPGQNGGPVLDVALDLALSSGEAVSPLVWSPRLRSPLGQPLKDVGLRVVNRTAFYACKPQGERQQELESSFHDSI